MTLRVAIVDDELHARAAIRIVLDQRADVEVIAECRSGVEAVELLQWMRVDLLFLDIQMPEVDGFGVLHALGPDRVPPTVFVTAFDTYALRAFEIQALDYVLKPFDETRFLAVFDRARRRIDEHRAAAWAQRFLAATRDKATVLPIPPLRRLPVPSGNRTIFVSFDDIDWIEAADQYVIVHVGATEYLLRESLRRLADRLTGDRFVQVHRSHLVNVAQIREIARLGKGDAELTLMDGRRLRCSRRYRRALEQIDWTR